MYHVLLASQSPRRQSLLERSGFRVTVMPSYVDEQVDDPSLPPADQATLIAVRKATEVSRRTRGAFDFLVAADTVVWLPDGEPLNKPVDTADATRMLRMLAGRDHFVTTGVAIVAAGEHLPRATFHETTRVTMSPLDPGAIAAYIATGEPMDKAGSYGIQGLAGAFVRGIDGSWDNVVGLPVERVVHHARATGLIDRMPWELGT